MKKIKTFALLTAIAYLLGLTACTTHRPIGGSKDDGKIEIVFAQINDIYEISPLEGGKSGGLARLATIIKQLKQENKNTKLVLAGDFFSPSVIGTLKDETGKRIAGKQMVDVLNVAGLDIATFGNHEFDIKEDEVQSRLNESAFTWVSSNVKNVKNGKTDFYAIEKGNTSTPIPSELVLDFSDADGTKLAVGMLAVTLPFNKQAYVAYEDENTAAMNAYNRLKDKTDFVVGLTHLNLPEDISLAKKLPNLKLLMGGHEHENNKIKEGNVVIAKADANIKTLYIHRILYDKKTKTATINSELKRIDNTIKDDLPTALAIQKWNNLAEISMKKMGFEPNKKVYETKIPLEGREGIIRTREANLPQLITKSMSKACKDCDCAMMNSGSVRVDDVVTGILTEYDILRILPFGGSIGEVKMKGELLSKILETGLKNAGSGGYLQWDGISYQQNTFKVNGNMIDPKKTYKVAITEFLLSGKEKNLDFLNDKNPLIESITLYGTTQDRKRDVRLLFIDYLNSL
jgi:2',3'-cyclic-nucleotide 2'-phosphodiesterase (5'-nucleotidase family)